MKRLMPRHFRIRDLALQGLSRIQIAQTVGMTPEAVGLIMAQPIFQDELARAREPQDRAKRDENVRADRRAQEILLQASKRAAEVHEELLEDDDSAVRQRSAEAILNRALGRGSIGGGEGGGVSGIQISTDSINLIRITLEEVGFRGGEARQVDRKPLMEKGGITDGRENHTTDQDSPQWQDSQTGDQDVREAGAVRPWTKQVGVHQEIERLAESNG